MGLLTNRVDRSEIRAGDHIYTYRAVFAYSHHGIYVGGSKVVHFTRIEASPDSDEEMIGRPLSCPTFPDCGFRQPRSGVVLSCLDCFLRNGASYSFEYGVTPSVFLAKVRGGRAAMEGLVKGLIDVVLGGDGDDGERRDERRSQPQSHHDQQQPRSSWAEVVSGEQDNDGFDRDQGRHDYDTRKENYGRNEGWGSSGSHPVMKPHKPSYERDDDDYGRKDNQSNWKKQEGGKSSDGWETVHKKPSRHQKVHMDHWNNYKCAPEEQSYAEEVNCGNDMEPSQEELEDLSKASNKLWELDLNRLIPGKDYEIDVGEGKKVYDRGDRAEGSLFSWVNEDIFRRPTFSRFCSLLDNYNPHEGYKENVTYQEKQEQTAFIEEISRTAPLKYLYNYLVAKRMVSQSYDEFKRMLTSLWFDLYNRGGTCGSSSAFEHVFVGEIKQQGEQEVSGFHNWLQFYLEEAKGRVDYQGYIFPRRRGEIPDSETQLLTIQFEWNGVLKSVSSTLVGVSPEFELALYTLCFFVGGEENHLELGPYPVNVKCFRFGNKLGSSFPIAKC